MRLLLLTNNFPNPIEPTRGVFNLEMARALAQEHDVRVVAPVSWLMPGARNVPFRTRLEGIEVAHPAFYYTPCMMRSFYTPFMARSVEAGAQAFIDSHRPEAVVGYWAHPDGEVATQIARRHGVPSIVITGGSDVLVLTRDPIRRAVVVRALAAADAVVTVSSHLRDAVVSLGIPAARTSVIRRGVDPARFAPGDRAEARARLGVPPDIPLLLWAGRMEHVKGLDVLIDACRLLKNRGERFQLVLVGNGALNETARTACARNRLGDVITFAGTVPHERLADWYRAATATVLASRSEGIPNVLLESIACGTPFVASRVGGISEIADPVLDTLVEPGDAAALGDALADVIHRRLDGASRRIVPHSHIDAARALAGLIGRLRRPIFTPAAVYEASGDLNVSA